jgi:hypothetical protein
MTQKTQKIHGSETFSTYWYYTRNDQVKIMTYPNGHFIGHSYTPQGASSVEWHFFRSPITGKIGPSVPLHNFLIKNGFEVIIY